MKECLYCKKEFNAARKWSKFCSTNCRVYYNRKNPQQKVTPLQIRVLYNTMIEALSKINYAPPQEVYDAPKFSDNFQGDEPLSFDKLAANASVSPFDAYSAEIKIATRKEDLEVTYKEVERDKALSKTDRQTLKDMINSRFANQDIFND